jgi:hypothetical protein
VNGFDGPCCHVASAGGSRTHDAHQTVAAGVTAWQLADNLYLEEDKAMSDRPEGTVADAGEAVQRKINQAGEAQDQIVDFIRDNPITAALLAIGIGYVLGKLT